MKGMTGITRSVCLTNFYAVRTAGGGGEEKEISQVQQPISLRCSKDTPHGFIAADLNIIQNTKFHPILLYKASVVIKYLLT